MKVLILTGDAGYGKTTLASVVLTTAGFNCVEINARYLACRSKFPHSDDRSGLAVIELLKSAMSSDSISGTPNAIILDEIDGALSSDKDSV